ELILSGIVGTVIIDIDVLFTRLSDKNPRYYIFTHGGFTHSIAGSSLVAFLAAGTAIGIMGIASPAGTIPGFSSWLLIVIVFLIGAWLHVGMDFLACPGVPLFYPFTDRKFTLGIFAGPNLFIMAGTVVFTIALLTGIVDLSGFFPYGVFFLSVIAAGILLKLYVKVTWKGHAIPTMNPNRWLLIYENEGSYTVRFRKLFGTEHSKEFIFQKYHGIQPAEINPYKKVPEVKRLRYHSFLMTVEKNENSIIFRDPVREAGIIWYPPGFKSLVILG
ncbi:metal-dependent hydrolase, partial [Methanoregula sp.]|uniref:metal-dependent hydrolase n=1 Tax=Methanoregula sp. TaxID=2052170 RepID=UPI000CB791E6